MTSFSSVPRWKCACAMMVIVGVAGCAAPIDDSSTIAYEEEKILVARIVMTTGTAADLDAWWSPTAPDAPQGERDDLALVVYKGDVAVGPGLVTGSDERAVAYWWSTLTGTGTDPGDTFRLELRDALAGDRLAAFVLEVER